ncbi:MAG TPA: DMT family transporter [Rubrivivax sp.]|nr:DMT family transporter [Rubrivivax sp.]
MTHRRAVLLMAAVTAMWSIAGIVTRQLEHARSFEITFWRSLFCALALALMLGAMRGPGALWRTLRGGGRALWISGACWAVMFTAFMVALSLTTVANVLVTMALGPLFTALGARFALGHALPLRTWAAIAAAGAGIAWMYGSQFGAADAQHLAGVGIALAVPLAGAVNWTLLQHLHHGEGDDDAPAPDMLVAVLLGAVLSALLTLPPALPFAATGRDLALLGLLGVVQLAVPCLLAVRVARVLKAPEIALLALLEVIFGVVWVWLGSTESPTPAVLGGGALVLGALAVNEALALRQTVRAAGTVPRPGH